MTYTRTTLRPGYVTLQWGKFHISTFGLSES